MNLTIELEGRSCLDESHVAEFRGADHFDEIYIRTDRLFRREDALKVELVRSAAKITIWADVTRASVGHLVSLPNLQELFLFDLRPHGRLTGFADARDLINFSCAYGLSGKDLLEVAKAPNLQKLGAQNSNLTKASILALVAHPRLTHVDFECTDFDDDLAELISRSQTITSLEVGCTRVTKIGLEKLCSMPQLRELDIWSNNIGEADFDMLSRLKNLEYLSVGGHDDQTEFTLAGTLPRLKNIPSLKRVWLDGFRVTRDEWNELNRLYEQVTVTSVTDT